MKIQQNVVFPEFFPQKFPRGKQLLPRPHLNREGRGHISPHPISVDNFGVSMSLPKTNPTPSDNPGSATEEYRLEA